MANYKTMRVTIRIRRMSKQRKFMACGRMMTPGRGSGGGKRGSTCSPVTSSPRKAVANVLARMAKKLKRKGHKRFGRK
jgi:hypothetical protein